MLQTLSSTVQVNYPAQGEMVVLFPRQIVGPVFLFLVGLVLAFFAGALIKSTGPKILSLLYALGFLPLLAAVYLMTSSSTLNFSRASNSVVLMDEAFFHSSQHTYALKEVDHAEVAQDDGASHTFYLALTSQDRVPVGGGWMPRRGYFQAANAVNLFLNQTRATDSTSTPGTSPNEPASSMEELGQHAIAEELAARKQAQH